MIDYTAVASRTFRTNEARIVFPGKCKRIPFCFTRTQGAQVINICRTIL